MVIGLWRRGVPETRLSLKYLRLNRASLHPSGGHGKGTWWRCGWWRLSWVDACECSAHPFSWRWRCSTRVVGRSSSTSSHVANRPNPPQTCLGVEHIFVQRRSRGLQALRTLEAAAKGACRFTLPHQQLSRSQWRRRRARPLARRKHGNIVGEEVLQSRGRAGLAGRRVR